MARCVVPEEEGGGCLRKDLARMLTGSRLWVVIRSRSVGTGLNRVLS